MQNTFQHRTILRRATVLLGSAMLAFLLSGCGEHAPALEAKVSSPVGRPGVCVQCNKKIDDVSEENLVTVEGVEYIVCDEKCAADLKKWIAEQ